MEAEIIERIIRNVDSRGYLKSRESSKVEFKESFNFSQMPKYLRTIAAFANAHGGTILFGIKDSPRIPIGINPEKFDTIKQEKVTTFLLDFFSPQIFWNISLIEIDSKCFGYINIEESSDKPVICKKTKNVLKDGEIYYRYRGQTRVIQFAELKKIKEEIIAKERSLWMDHIERISRIGPENVAFIDLFDGSIQSKKIDGNIVLDGELLDDLKRSAAIIDEASFKEADGAPALRITGEIKSSDNIIIPLLDPNKDYPYIVKHLGQELGIRPYDAQVLVWKYQLKGNNKYHLQIEAGTRTKIDKYSNHALRFLRTELIKQADQEKYLRNASREYQLRKKKRRKG